MKAEDRQLCELVLSPGEEIGRVSHVKVLRGGSLLLALPLNRSVAMATLGLYQPQRWKGRLLRKVMKALVGLGLHRFLPKIQIKIGSSGLFSGLGESASLGKFGFLLGSADSEERNLIGLYRDDDGSFSVVKAGCGISGDIVRAECASMQKFAGQVDGVPECRRSFDIEGGVAYVAELVKGRSPRGNEDDKRVFDLLMAWLGSGVEKVVADLDCWKSLQAGLGEEAMTDLESLATSKVLSPVMHGDFAPWNIKMGRNGSVKVLDWEYAAMAGMPGWDWLHYQVQRMRLVKGKSADVIVSSCRALLRSEPMRSYLAQAGLRGMEDILLGSYLLYSGKVHAYPREDLIKVWSSTREAS